LTRVSEPHSLIIDIDNQRRRWRLDEMLTAVLVPESLDAVQAALADGARPLAGGTYLMPRLNNRATPPTRLVSLRRTGLDRIAVGSGAVRIGATTTLARIEDDERLAVLHACVRSVAARPVRSLATVAGNLFASQPYGDLTVALLALDAEVEIQGPVGARTQPLSRMLSTGLEPNELVTGVRFAAPAAFRYHKAGRRRFNSAGIVTVAAALTMADGVVRDVRIALGGLAPRPLRCDAAERALVGRRLDEASVRDAAGAAEAVIEPFDDAHASAWYRRRVFPVHLRRALLGH
jgi:aerobic carbon-monoxide dehydrogenase medium subunit